MKRLQAFKFQIEPNGEQIRAMRQYAGNARKIWNLALNRQQELHTAGEKFTNSFGMNNWLPAWKQEFSYLCDSPSQTLQQVTKDLAAAYKNFFEKRADFPQFKKKGSSSDRFRFPQGFEIDEANRRIRLPKLGWIRYRNSRGIIGLAKNITVSCVAGKWYASIQTEREVEQPIHPSTSIVGLDAGITLFATLSDGTMFEPVNALRTRAAKMVKYH